MTESPVEQEGAGQPAPKPPGSANGESKGLAFNFQAKSKPVVAAVIGFEEKLFKKFLSKKPKYSLTQIKQALSKGIPNAELLKRIGLLTGFYYNHEVGPQYFESLGLLLLETAGQESGDAARQRFLMFQALDTLSIGLQKSPHMLNVSIQSAISSIYKVLGKDFRDNFAVERAIHQEMMEMLHVLKDPGDLMRRDKIIRLYMRGKRYYESLGQLAEYEKIMRAKSRPLYLQKSGEIAMRKAGTFQTVIDFYYQVKSGSSQESSVLADFSRLKSFIARFNRDNRASITPLKGVDAGSLQKTLVSMVKIAETFYRDAIKSVHFNAKHKASFLMARNAYRFDSRKQALEMIRDCIRVIEQEKMSPAQHRTEMLQALELQNTIFNDLGMKAEQEALRLEMAKLKAGKGKALAAPPA